MSAGECRQADGPWFEPGVGGSFYNPPGIVQAMRSSSEPLFAFWALRNTATDVIHARPAAYRSNQKNCGSSKTEN